MQIRSVLLKIVGVLSLLVVAFLPSQQSFAAQSSAVPAWLAAHIGYGDGQIQHGHAPIKAFNARRRKLGPDRALTETVVTTFGHDFATVSTLYVDVPPGKIGRQMQTWARLDGGWHVVAAHVSVVDAIPVDRGG